MQVNDIKLEEYKNKLKRKIARNNAKIANYELNKDNLSENGYWGLGYCIGANSQLENILDELDTLFED